VKKLIVLFILLSGCSYMGLGKDGGKTKGCYYKIELLNGKKDQCESITLSTLTYFWDCSSKKEYAVKDVIYEKVCQ